jgi:hypothetical protein
MDEEGTWTGDELNAWRKRMGLSLEQAAVALGLGYQSFIDNLYRHDRKPSARTVLIATNLEELKRLREREGA